MPLKKEYIVYVLKGFADIIVQDVHVHVCWSNGVEHKVWAWEMRTSRTGSFQSPCLHIYRLVRYPQGQKKTLLLIIQQDFKSHVPSIMPSQRPLWCVSVHRKHSRWQTRLIRPWRWQTPVMKSAAVRSCTFSNRNSSVFIPTAVCVRVCVLDQRHL